MFPIYFNQLQTAAENVTPIPRKVIGNSEESSPKS